MSENYRFNGGRGAATCAVCHVIVDENLSHSDYVELYPDDRPMCWRCVARICDKQEADDE